jgi:hypothetical protein
MCGIVGVLAFNEMPDNKAEKVRQEAMIYLATELLQITRSRGEDATGVANLFSDGNFFGLKMGVPSPDFITRFGGKETDYDGFLKVWRENFTKRKKTVKTFMGHCRKSSVGFNASDNNNNHPIIVGDILGIHNGTLTNHDQIFKMLKCKRDGDVDSEAIVRLIHHLTKAGKEPLSMDVLLETCKRLHGSYSCIMLNANSPNQVATFRDDRPAEVMIIRPLKLILIGSEDKFLKTALYRYQKMARLYPTTVKFPSLGKDDVDLKMMVNEIAYLWDLSHDIDNKTKIEDLYLSGKIERTGKLWAKGTATSTNTGTGSFSRYPNQNNNWANKHNATGSATEDNTTKKTEVDAKPATGTQKNTPETSTETESDDDNSPSGPRIWNKGMSKFEKRRGIEDTKKMGAVEINPGAGCNVESFAGEDLDKILGEDDKKNEKTLLPMKVVEGEQINTLMGNSAKVVQVPFPEEKENAKGAVVEEVDLSKVDPEALKKATKVAEQLAKFDNDEEVIAALNADATALKKAPLYALANRIVKTVFIEAFALGYANRKHEEVKTSPKLKKKETVVMALKETVTILSDALHASRSTYTLRKELIERALIEKLNRGEAKNVTEDALTKIFSVADFKNNKSLRTLKLALMSRKHRD